MAQSPTVLAVRGRLPRLTGFLIHRFDPHDPWGLSGTLAIVVIGAGLWFFVDVTTQVLARDPVVMLDLRLHNVVPLFRTTGMTWFMLALTTLGSPWFLFLLSFGLGLLALAANHRRLAVALPLVLALCAIVSTLIKVTIGHERPIDAIVGAHAGSFPSGHMLSSSVLYGLIAALLLGTRVRPGLRGFAVTSLLLLIVGVGLSRLYLGVHWPSDLLGSLGLALMVLPCAIFFLHYTGSVRWVDTLSVPVGVTTLRVLGVFLLIIALCAAAIAPGRTEIYSVGPPEASYALGNEALRTSFPPELRTRSEDLTGGEMEPVSLVFIGSEQSILDTFTRAGWTKADAPTPLRVVQEMYAAILNRPDLSGPATPAFLGDRPQTLTFEKPDSASPSIRRRHHTRLWQTQYCRAPRCRPVWVATASFDIGVRLSEGLHLPTHRIDSAIDEERSLIVADLTGANAILAATIAVTQPLRGKNAAGDSFWTDGRAAVLVMPQDMPHQRE